MFMFLMQTTANTLVTDFAVLDLVAYAYQWTHGHLYSILMLFCDGFLSRILTLTAREFMSYWVGHFLNLVLWVLLSVKLWQLIGTILFWFIELLFKKGGDGLLKLFNQIVTNIFTAAFQIIAFLPRKLWQTLFK